MTGSNTTSNGRCRDPGEVKLLEATASTIEAEEWLAMQSAGGWHQPTNRRQAVPLEISGQVDWHQLLTRGAPEPTWLVEPIIPAGRMTALVASAKTGKSLLALDLALALAAGREFLGKPAGVPVKVLLLDFEMTEDDLAERVEDMGFGVADADDLSNNLHYYLTPNIETLNTSSGASQLLAMVDLESPKLVIVDTLSRVMSGDENSSEPYLDAYRRTWSQLKSRGIAVLRLDHTGHESTNRSRGSSAKRDDVDLSWTMKAADGGVRLAHHGTSRMGWVPASVDLIREIGAVPLHRLAESPGLPAGTTEWAAILDRLKAPTDIGERKLRLWLKAANRLESTVKASPPRGEVLRAAIRYRNGVGQADREAAS